MPRFENMSIPAFAVAEEFILLSIITISSVLLDNYLLWFGVFMGFFMHLLIHLAQWLILRKYIPVIYTTIISLVYCLFSLRYILKENITQKCPCILHLTYVEYLTPDRESFHPAYNKAADFHHDNSAKHGGSALIVPRPLYPLNNALPSASGDNSRSNFPNYPTCFQGI